MKQMTSVSLMHETGHSGPVLWDDPEGWMGRNVGGGSGWVIHVHPWSIMSMYGKINYNLVK